jgi:hypothetical protein
MTVCDMAEVAVERMVQDLVFRQSHGLARRDRHAVQAEPLRVDAEILNREYFSPRLKYLRALAGSSPTQTSTPLLGAGERSSDLARPAQERVDLFGELGVDGGGVENRRDLDSGFPRVHGRSVHTAQRSQRSPSRLHHL